MPMINLPTLLASQSPRRRRLLQWLLGSNFEVTSVDTEENLDTPLASDPAALAISLAVEKATAAADDGLAVHRLTLCFDTIVVHAGEVLGKPVDEADAWRMLRSLSGQTHHVVTGAALLCPGQTQPTTFSATTVVSMKALTDCQIEAWMAMGTFMGCAGAYNIEAQVAEVTSDECCQNVAGLPLCHLARALRTLPDECVPLGMSSPIAPCDAALARTCALGPALLGEA